MFRDSQELYIALLTVNAEERARAKEMRRRATETLREAIPQAVAAGISVREIAELAGMTRAAVYQYLRGER